jgi:type II secretory pathway component PulF
VTPRLPASLAVLSLASATIVVVVAYLFVPEFVDIYSGFAIALPWYSELLVASYRWFILLPAAVILAWVAWPRVPRRSWVAAAIGLIGAPLLLFLGMWAAYRPIWIAGLEK